MRVLGSPIAVEMSMMPTRPRNLSRDERLWLRYLIADLEGDAERMRRVGHVLDELRPVSSGRGRAP